jgi:hypothetical protein
MPGGDRELMPWWEDDAVLSQRRKRQDEQEANEPFSEEEAHRAAAYTRDDLSLVVSYLSSLNQQISAIKSMIAFLLVLILLIPLALFVMRTLGRGF